MKRLWCHVAEAVVTLAVLFVPANAATKQVSSSNITVAARASFGLSQSVIVDNGYAYIGADNHFVSLSLSNPQSPTYSSFSYPFKYIQDLTSNADYVFATLGSDGIEVIPKSTSSDLSTIKTFDFGAFIERITIDATGGFLYVTTQDSGVMIIDIIGDSLAETGTITGGFGTPNDVEYFNDTLVVGGSEGVCFYDVSTPATPVMIDSISTRHPVFRVSIADGLLVYVTQWREGWTSYYAVNLSNGQNNYSIESGEGNISDVCVKGNDIFVLNSSGKLTCYKLNSGVVDKVSEMVLESGAFDFDVDSNFVYLIEDDGFRVVDYSSGTLTSVSMVYATRKSYEFAKYKDYLFVAGGQSGVMIIDISDTLNPRFAGRIPCNRYSRAITVKDSFLLCASLFQSLELYNISDPVSPVFVSNLHVRGNPVDITWKDSIVYIATNSSGVSIVNVSSPGSPEIIGNINTGRTTQSVKAYGNYLIVSDLHSGSYLYSIQNAANPNILATLGSSRVAAPNDTLLILATPDSSLMVYDIKDPQSPKILYTVTLPQNANALSLVGNMLYTVCGDSGIRVYSLGSTDVTLKGYFVSGNKTNDVLPLTTSLFFITEENRGVYLLNGTFPRILDIEEDLSWVKNFVTLNGNLGNSIEFSIKSDRVAEYRLVDVTGRVLKRGRLQGEKNASITNLRSGIYYLVVNIGAQVNVKKILIR